MKRPLTLVISTVDSPEESEQVDGDVYNFGYELIKPIEFDEPHYVRLVHFVAKSSTAFIVCCDFVKDQPNNGAYKGFLGIGGKTSENHYIPLARNSVPSSGLYLRTSSDWNKDCQPARVYASARVCA